MQGSGGRENVLEVLGAGLLEAVERAAAEVLGEALVLLALAWQLHRLVFGDGRPHHLTVETLAVQMAHSCTRGCGRGGNSQPWIATEGRGNFNFVG